MTTLKAGEIGILQNMFPEHARLNGEEATVKRLCAAGERFNIAGQRGFAPENGYVVDVRRFGIAWVRNDQLRRPQNSEVAKSVAADFIARLRNPQEAV